MGRLNLEANGANEKVVLDYLEANVSDTLAERINVGKKALKHCWNYITEQAREKAVNGCACIDDQTVFGWAVHFFEEESIKAEDYEKARTKSVVKTTNEKAAETTEAPTPKPQKVSKPKSKVTINGADQIGFDFFGG